MSGSSSYIWILYIVAFGAVFYFMAIRPQSKQRKAHMTLLSSLKKGDTVQTAAGIYGKVKRIEEEKNLVVIEIAKGVSIKVPRRAIVEIVTDSALVRAIAPEGPTTTRSKRGQPVIEESVDEVDSEFTEATNVADETDQDSTENES